MRGYAHFLLKTHGKVLLWATSSSLKTFLSISAISVPISALRRNLDRLHLTNNLHPYRKFYLVVLFFNYKIKFGINFGISRLLSPIMIFGF